MRKVLVLLTLFFLGANKFTYSQNIDTVEYNFNNGSVSLIKYNNLGVYYFTNNAGIDSDFYSRFVVREISPYCFILKDSGNDILSNYPNLTPISIFRLYKNIECNSTITDTLGCYIFTNAISGKFDTIHRSEFLNLLEDSGVVQMVMEADNFIFILPLGRDLIQFSNSILVNENVISSGPEILFDVKLGSLDPLYQYQTNLHNAFSTQYDINVEPAWEITKGSNLINIGIMDDGVSNEHPDLDPSKLIIKAGSNFATGFIGYEYNNNSPPYWAYDLNLYPWDDPNKPIPNQYLRAVHGTAMAGIIGADHNNIGIKGIAPNCKILPVKFATTQNSANQIAHVYDSYLAPIIKKCTDWPIDVLNSSWYVRDVYLPPGYPFKIPYSWENLENLIKTGRNGRGTTVVACTGNERTTSDCHGIAKPASLNINGLIAVGACNQYGYLTNYSNCGNGIDLVAIAPDIQLNNSFYYGFDFFTLDLPGSQGYNPTNVTEVHTSFLWIKNFNGQSYPTSAFGNDYADYLGFASGTSVATAQVTGAVGLLLSENPCLKSTEIEVILKRNARKINSNTYNYSFKQGEPGWSRELGYGLLDVFQSLIDPLWDQNVNYTTEFGIKGGTIYAGNNVTTAIPTGDVKIKNGGNVTYLAFRTIEIYEGFEVSNNGEFLAEIYHPDFPDCYNWDKVSIPILGDVYSEVYNNGMIQYKPVTNNLNYLSLNALEIDNNKKVNLNSNNNYVLDFIAFPNPNNESKIILKFSEPLKKYVIEVRDMVGSIVLQTTNNSESDRYELTTEKFKPGIYFIILIIDGVELVKKISII